MFFVFAEVSQKLSPEMGEHTEGTFFIKGGWMDCLQSGFTSLNEFLGGNPPGLKFQLKLLNIGLPEDIFN